MADRSLRELQRAAAQGDPQAAAGWLQARLRSGGITPGRIEAASFLRHSGARILRPDVAPYDCMDNDGLTPMEDWLPDLAKWDLDLCILAGLIACDYANERIADTNSARFHEARCAVCRGRGEVELDIEWFTELQPCVSCSGTGIEPDTSTTLFCSWAYFLERDTERRKELEEARAAPSSPATWVRVTSNMLLHPMENGLTETRHVRIAEMVANRCMVRHDSRRTTFPSQALIRVMRDRLLQEIVG